ncbi:hypothetical protein LJR175_007826 [Variovorax sp. LjRoot175]|uniref:hypothetical protein n=1 Tax=Variovorax sp. LjRoot175 TaxID=3342276 RepID=UPI003ECE6F01
MRGRLWRAVNPGLTREERQHLIDRLMDARRAVAAARRSGEAAALRQARDPANAAKLALGERGPVWWTDGAPDLNRRLVCNTPYAKASTELPVQPARMSHPVDRLMPTHRNQFDVGTRRAS